MLKSISILLIVATILHISIAVTPQIKAVINNNDEVEIPGAKDYVTRLTTGDFEYSLKNENKK